MDSNELLGQYIKVEKKEPEIEENQNIPKPTKQPKTKKEQFDKIVAFHQHFNNDISNEMWDILTTELNEIGPPVHTCIEWKRTWSVHKYNKKRKRLSTVPDNELPGASLLDQTSYSNDPLDATGFDFQSEILGKLCEITEKQNVLIEKQDEIIQNLKMSNNFLEQIAKKI